MSKPQGLVRQEGLGKSKRSVFIYHNETYTQDLGSSHELQFPTGPDPSQQESKELK
jgi:hypothetical protein